ncbi:MAG: amidohydrolase family protein [Pyrinomonadaceae bacterium]
MNFLVTSLLLLSFAFVNANYAIGMHQANDAGPLELLIENVEIISPAKNVVRRFTGYVLLRDNLIAYVGDHPPKVNPNTIRIDGRGKFLIPGLIDSHVHLANVAGLNWPLKKKYPDLAAAYYEQVPRSYLYFGYTTLIDPNNYSPKVLNAMTKQAVHPDIITCGEQLEVLNGFMMAETEPAERLAEFPHFLFDRHNSKAVLPGGTTANDHSPAAAVRRIVNAQKGRCVKMAHENGFGGTEEVTWQMPSEAIVKEVAAESRRSKIPFLLHASSFESQQFAVDTGVDIIAHGMWHWGPLFEFLDVSKLPQTHRTLLETIARKHIGYQPTFRVIAGQRDVFDDAFINDPILDMVYPRPLMDLLRSPAGRWQQDNIRKYGKGFFDNKSNADIVPFMQKMVDKIGAAAKVIEKNKGDLLFGSDTPSSNAHTNPPGYNGYLEMKEWYTAGLSLKSIFRAATINNAKAFHLDSSVGTIANGKTANLLLLRKDPLKDISAYDSIEMVILGGKPLDRKGLSANAKR